MGIWPFHPHVTQELGKLKIFQKKSKQELCKGLLYATVTEAQFVGCIGV